MDTEPIGARYQRRAKAAADAAATAVKTFGAHTFGTEAEVARIEAAGRIASALILADQQEHGA